MARTQEEALCEAERTREKFRNVVKAAESARIREKGLWCDLFKSTKRFHDGLTCLGESLCCRNKISPGTKNCSFITERPPEPLNVSFMITKLTVTTSVCS
jgi:hypothetical protein